MEKSFVTTPIYYVNDVPHIGHAYTTVAADVFARTEALSGKDTYLITGTDEHGAKIAKAAKARNISPQALADEVSASFETAWKNLDISYNQFARTTNPEHEKLVQEILSKIHTNNFIYKGVYSGLYCVGCEEYKKPEDLDNGNCPIHKKPVEELKEDVWFFKLSAFTKQVTDLIEDGSLVIYPQERRNEVLSFLKNGLEDIAISRSQVEWGINLPWDKEQTIYVWIDALLYYYTHPNFAKRSEIFPPDTQFIGKDILRFHAIIWPALLLAAELPTPKKIAVNGFFTINNQKMSKSLGNVIRPDELIEEFGVDATRYLLLSQFPFGSDGDFSIETLKSVYNSELANNLGNLLQRTLVVAQKLQIDPAAITNETEVNYFLINECKFYEAIQEINELLRGLNQYIDQEKPWSLEPKSQKASDVISHIINGLYTVAYLLKPIMPTVAQKIVDQLESGKPEPLFLRK